MATSAKSPKSIQGERQAARDIWADQSAVDAYAETHPDEILDCRSRGRHMFPSIKQTGLVFGRVNALGLHVREVGCIVCVYPDDHEKAGQPRVVCVEQWDVRHYRGTITRCELVSGTLKYLDPKYQGKKGEGRIKPKRVRNALGTAALKGTKFVALRKEIMAAVKAREESA